MTVEEIKLHRMWGQHLLVPADTQTVVKDLCGVQAQFLSHALHGLSIRTEKLNTDGLVKSWTNRGTMHLFSVDDLPLFLHEGRSRFLRPVDTMDSDAYMDANRKALYEGLTSFGYEMANPDGAFYLFIKAPGGDANAFSEKAKARDLLLVPGDGFGCPGWFRLCYCVSYDKIQRSLPIFKELIQEAKG